MRNAVLVLVCSLTLAACVAHEKAGDSAAAVGDWKSAYNHYRQALAEKPDTPGLKDKHDQARTAAVSEAWQRAQGCEASNDWRCAYDESEFVRSLDPMRGDAIALRSRAATQLAIAEVHQARTVAGAGKYQEAFAILNKARAATQDPAVHEQAAVVQSELVEGASIEADRLRSNRQYNESLALYEMLAGIDPSYQGAVRAVTDEREQYSIALYEREARRGDEALHQNDFRAAHAAYLEAEKLRPNGRAQPLLRYTEALISADDAISARNWSGAEQALRTAVNTGKDDGRAAEMLDRVKFRTYKVSLHSVLLKPTRPDGNAWVGNTTPLFFRIAQQVDAALAKNSFDRAISNTQDLPYENRPNIKVVVAMPDGQRLESKAQQGGYALFDGEFTVAANGFDERRFTFHVFQEQGNEEIGRVEMSLRELITRKDLGGSSQTIAQVRVITQPADGRQPGTWAGLTEVARPAAPAPAAVAGSQAPPVAPVNNVTPVAPANNVTPAAGTEQGTTAPAATTTTGTVTPAGGTAPAPVQPEVEAPPAAPGPKGKKSVRK